METDFHLSRLLSCSPRDQVEMTLITRELVFHHFKKAVIDSDSRHFWEDGQAHKTASLSPPIDQDLSIQLNT
jgi:hypothetical protein